MKSIMRYKQLHNLILKSFFLSICLLFITSCAGQIEKNATPLKFIPEQTKIHADSISLKAETLPEYRVDVHDKDYQGNQISGVVRTVFQDSKGNFWFGTQSGLCRKDKNGLVYFDIKNRTGQGVTVHVILEDKTGAIWIGYGGGIAKYDGTYFTNYHEKDILTTGGLWSMLMDSKGTLWIGTTQGVFTFDGKAFTPFEIPEGKVNPNFGVSTSKMIHSITEDSKGNIWFATNGGAYRFDGNTLTNISAKDQSLSNFVNRIIERADGTYWISTVNGLFLYDGTTFKSITEKLLGKDEGVGCIFEDKTGTIWFIAYKRDIYNYNGKTFQKIEAKIKISDYIVLPFEVNQDQQKQEGNFSPFPFQIYQDRQQRIWFVGFKGAYRFENNAFVNVTRNGPW
ncbi:MAG TPA: two-component regulator propeller domain-containing protein [Flavobacterium sp.]|nr:two-component regulator propeller domain-containing protein [Flavobacterium sp. UBA2787]HRE78904.1 two-component regulator propeller domain-containing protein [Flavobacterium sp.]